MDQFCFRLQFVHEFSVMYVAKLAEVFECRNVGCSQVPFRYGKLFVR